MMHCFIFSNQTILGYFRSDLSGTKTKRTPGMFFFSYFFSQVFLITLMCVDVFVFIFLFGFNFLFDAEEKARLTADPAPDWVERCMGRSTMWLLRPVTNAQTLAPSDVSRQDCSNYVQSNMSLFWLHCWTVGRSGDTLSISFTAYSTDR